ncbi:ribosome recycling factor protein [Besnoitia besnoiti]|uniref:Ribosome recycling factor protein n=1 Tax=Besnoitia besnoiti TaxID=94643 RepID=A0A2A9MAD6_BESBE|nr:ribosome recycling factor protein [Besnoitia besnoiti]PFH34869.1 ribosome recycling factor protein [Besnoitia besnoiti]
MSPTVPRLPALPSLSASSPLESAAALRRREASSRAATGSPSPAPSYTSSSLDRWPLEYSFPSCFYPGCCASFSSPFSAVSGTEGSLQPLATQVPWLSDSRREMAGGKKKKGGKDDGRQEDKRMRKVLKIIGGDAEREDDAPARAPRGVGGRAKGLERAKARGFAREEEDEEEDNREHPASRGGRDAHVDTFDVKQYEEEMKHAIEKMLTDLTALLVQRERAEHFEKILISTGGEKKPLSDLAQVVVRGASTVHVHVFSEGNLSKVMSALRVADAKWMIQQEGNSGIKLQLPKMTPEMREELKTKARVFLVTAKSAVRNLRQAGRSQLHKLQFKTRSIDDVKRRELDATLTSLMENYVTKCDKVFNDKIQQTLV